MQEEKLILENISLIYKVIKGMNLYWKTEDEFQDIYDAGLEGLIRGAKAYDPTQTKAITYLSKCIKNNIVRNIYLSELDKRKVNKQYKISLDSKVPDSENTTYADFISDPNVNVEEEIEKKLEIERLLIAIKNLKNEKDKIMLCEFYGVNGYKRLSLSELQEKYKVSRSCIGFRLSRAKKTLKKYLEKNQKEAFAVKSQDKEKKNAKINSCLTKREIRLLKQAACHVKNTKDNLKLKKILEMEEEKL